MACDTFSSKQAQELLNGKLIYFFGDSNIRAIYKDLLWLLEDGRLISLTKLKTKNESSFANDTRISNGVLHAGRTYEEIRNYHEKTNIWFYFITRLYLPEFIDVIKNLNEVPDVIIISSSVWDISRWGPNGVAQFKNNLLQTFSFLKTQLPSTRVIWTTATPVTFSCRGGFLQENIKSLRKVLPFHLMYCNRYAYEYAYNCGIDVLDIHYVFKLLLNYQTHDGIHWQPSAVRLATNMLLTHLALLWDFCLPKQYKLDIKFLKSSSKKKFVFFPGQKSHLCNGFVNSLEEVLNRWKKYANENNNAKSRPRKLKSRICRV